MENSNLNINDVNSNEDTNNLENLRALFATLEKREIDSQYEKQILKVENQSKKLELKESQKENEHLLQELEKVQSKNQNLQKNLEDVQNEKEKKDTEIENLKMELTELKQAIQSFLSGNLTLKSMSNLVKNSATPEIVPKQSEKVQRAEMSHSNDEEEQISDLMPDQQAVQTPDSQLLTFPPSEVQEQKQQPKEVTKLERIQHDQISYTDEGIDQILDQIPAQAVQTPDDQLQTSEDQDQQQQQQPMEDTQLETKLEKHSGVLCISFDDGSDGYIKEYDNDGIDLIPCDEDLATLNVTDTVAITEEVFENISSERLYSCQYCFKDFRKKSYLKNHELIHTSEKPFSCGYCSKMFRQKTSAKVHERIHTGEKPYSCTYCSKMFRQKTGVRNHERIHTGEKPYNCKTCNKCFSDKSTLRRHELIHSGKKPYPCKYCSKMFRQKKTVKNHERTHTGEKPYACKTCNKCFSDPRSMKKHELIHRGGKSLGTKEKSASDDPMSQKFGITYLKKRK